MTRKVRMVSSKNIRRFFRMYFVKLQFIMRFKVFVTKFSPLGKKMVLDELYSFIILIICADLLTLR